MSRYTTEFVRQDCRLARQKLDELFKKPEHEVQALTERRWRKHGPVWRGPVEVPTNFLGPVTRYYVLDGVKVPFDAGRERAVRLARKRKQEHEQAKTQVETLVGQAD